jgi:hypothetical protein
MNPTQQQTSLIETFLEKYGIINWYKRPDLFIETFIRTEGYHGLMPLKLYDWQRWYVRHLMNTRKVVMKVPRQVGCTLINLAYIVYYSTINSDRNVIVTYES